MDRKALPSESACRHGDQPALKTSPSGSKVEVKSERPVFNCAMRLKRSRGDIVDLRFSEISVIGLPTGNQNADVILKKSRGVTLSHMQHIVARHEGVRPWIE